MVAPTPFFADRGCHVRIYEEVRALQKRGHEVVVVSYHLGDDPPGVIVERIPGWMWWYRKLEAGGSWWKVLLDVMLVVKVWLVARRFESEVLHCHLHEGALIGWVVNLVRGGRVPLVFDYQGSLVEEMEAHGVIGQSSKFKVQSYNLKLKMCGFNLFHRLEKWIDGVADFIITSSERGKEELAREFGMEAEKVVNVGDGVGAVAIKRFKIQDLRFKKSLGIGEKEKVIVYAGLLEKYQGVDLLLKAMKKLVKKRKRVKLVMIGYPNVERCRKMVDELGIGEWVIFLGRVSYFKLGEYLRLADVAAAPKMAETEGNGKLYAYAAAGLVSVVFDNRVNREILGRWGVYAKKNDVNDLAKKMEWCLRNPKKLAELRRGLRREVVKRKSWDRLVRQLERVYEKTKNDNQNQ